MAGRLGASLLIAGACAAAAFAARPPLRAKPVPTPAMEVHLVRSGEPGCEPGCPEWIAAQGRIEAGTLRRFKAALAKAGKRRLPVLIHSPGGSVADALSMARLVRARGLDVVVSKTDLVTCDRQDAECRKLAAKGVRIGVPVADAAMCLSACPFVLAGGVRRLAGPGGAIGVHRISTFQIYTKVLRRFRYETKTQWGIPVGVEKRVVSEKTLSRTKVPTVTSDKSYAELKSFFIEMGVSPDIMPLVQRTPSDRIRWLSAVELVRFKLVTRLATGEQLILRSKVKVNRPAAWPGGPPRAIPSRPNARPAAPTAAKAY